MKQKRARDEEKTGVKEEVKDEQMPPFDFLQSNQVPIFTDNITLYRDGEMFKCHLCIIDVMVFVLYREKKTLAQTPFKIEDLEEMIMSPSQPTSSAFKLKDTQKYGRSHCIFQSFSMGLLVRFFQELELYDLKVTFHDSFPMTVKDDPVAFNFDDITKSQQKK